VVILLPINNLSSRPEHSRLRECEVEKTLYLLFWLSSSKRICFCTWLGFAPDAGERGLNFALEAFDKFAVGVDECLFGSKGVLLADLRLLEDGGSEAF
jgi:hypothetical protein